MKWAREGLHSGLTMDATGALCPWTETAGRPVDLKIWEVKEENWNIKGECVSINWEKQ